MFSENKMREKPIYDENGNLLLKNNNNLLNCAIGYTYIENENFIKIEKGKKYIFTIDVKSIGEKKLSSFEPVIKCYKNNNESSIIKSKEVCFVKNTENDIISSAILSGFFILGKTEKYSDIIIKNYLIGIYIDNEMDKLPSLLLKPISFDKTENFIKFSERDFSLITPFLEKKIKIRIHVNSRNDLCILNNFTAPPVWYTINYCISDLAWNNNNGNFRMGSEYFKIGFKVNINQTENEILCFRNFKILTLLN